MSTTPRYAYTATETLQFRQEGWLDQAGNFSPVDQPPYKQATGSFLPLYSIEVVQHEQPTRTIRCVFCQLGQPERCTGFVGVPVDGPRGQQVYECGTETPA